MPARTKAKSSSFPCTIHGATNLMVNQGASQHSLTCPVQGGYRFSLLRYFSIANTYTCLSALTPHVFSSELPAERGSHLLARPCSYFLSPEVLQPPSSQVRLSPELLPFPVGLAPVTGADLQLEGVVTTFLGCCIPSRSYPRPTLY